MSVYYLLTICITAALLFASMLLPCRFFVSACMLVELVTAHCVLYTCNANLSLLVTLLRNCRPSMQLTNTPCGC